MTDILIRGLSSEAVARLDAHAARLGLSRNEYLRRQLDAAAGDGVDPARVSAADIRRASQAARDLDDAEVMSAAWR